MLLTRAVTFSAVNAWPTVCDGSLDSYASTRWPTIQNHAFTGSGQIASKTVRKELQCEVSADDHFSSPAAIGRRETPGIRTRAAV